MTIKKEIRAHIRCSEFGSVTIDLNGYEIRGHGQLTTEPPGHFYVDATVSDLTLTIEDLDALKAALDK